MHKKTVVFLYTNDKYTENEIRKTSSFTKTNQQRNKQNTKKPYIAIHLTKEVKDIYKENFKTVRKEIKEEIRRWKDIPCLH